MFLKQYPCYKKEKYKSQSKNKIMKQELLDLEKNLVEIQKKCSFKQKKETTEKRISERRAEKITANRMDKFTEIKN